MVRSTALINPGAPSEMTSSGQPSPRSPSPVNNPSQASPDSDDAASNPTKTGLPAVSMPHPASTGSAAAFGGNLKGDPSSNRKANSTSSSRRGPHAPHSGFILSPTPHTAP